jgi:thermitase
MSEPALRALFGSHGANQSDVVQQLGVHILKVPESKRARVLNALKRNPDIEFVEPNYLVKPALVPNDSYYSSEWHLPKIQAAQAWDLSTGTNAVIVAILDTGIDATHPELAAKLVPGWNFYDNNADTSEVYRHGTAVAGTAAAASNNGTGVASLAWNCLIMPIRVSDPNGYGSTLAMSQGLIWAADHGARVANISYGVTGSATVTSAAEFFQSKNGVVTVSAGNESTFDASTDNPSVLTVSGTDTTDVLASWSNTGNNIDLAAPGVSIVTTGGGGTYVAGTGTSFSAPIVAGVAALVISANPSLTAVQVQDILKQNADDLGAPGFDTSFGFGRVNAYRAVLAATSVAPTPPDTTAPSVTITAPTPGSTVSGTVTISVSAADNVGITQVDCFVNGALLGTSSSA